MAKSFVFCSVFRVEHAPKVRKRGDLNEEFRLLNERINTYPTNGTDKDPQAQHCS